MYKVLFEYTFYLIIVLYKRIVNVWTVWPLGRNQRFNFLYLIVGV